MKRFFNKKLGVYLFFILSALITGALASLLTKDNMNIYSEIKAPPLSPPGFLFPVVWTVLYILMGISASLVWLERTGNRDRADTALLYYAASLVVNFIWSIIFFNFRSFLLAFAVLLVLLFLIIKTVLHYKKISPAAAYLQIPYILWVVFAGYLNFSIWILNG